MTYVKWHVDYTPFIDETWSSANTEVVGDFYDPIMSVKLGDSRDSFSFKVTNFNNNYDDHYNPNDKIAIYRSVNTDVKPADPIMIITLKDTPEEYSSKANMIRVEGYNFSESVLSAVVFIDVSNRTIPEAIQDALTDAGQDNPNFLVTWNSGNPDTKEDLSAFPDVDKKWFYKPIRSLVEEYSQNDKTKDGNYYWYINNDNEFIWRKETNVSSGTFDFATDACKKMKISKDIKGIRNYFILKGGMDPENHQITTPYVNWTSVATNGRKFMIVADAETQNTAKEMIDQDLSKSYSITDKQALSERYPSEIEAGTSFVTSWRATSTFTTKKYGISVTSGLSVTINEGTAAKNKEAYVEVIRGEVKNRLKSRGADISDNLQYGKLKVDLEYEPGHKTWGLGDLIICNIGTINANVDTPMRVQEIQYTSNSDVYSLQEDIGSIGK